MKNTIKIFLILILLSGCQTPTKAPEQSEPIELKQDLDESQWDLDRLEMEVGIEEFLPAQEASESEFTVWVEDKK